MHPSTVSWAGVLFCAQLSQPVPIADRRRGHRRTRAAIVLPRATAILQPSLSIRESSIMPLRSILAAMLGAALLVGLGEHAVAQDNRALVERIERMQRDIDVLQRRVATGGGGSGSAGTAALPSEGFVGQAEQRFSGLEAQSREQTGRLEEVQFKLRQLETKLDKLITDVEFRFQQLERGGAAPTTSLRNDTATSTAASGAGGGSPSNQRLVIVPSGTSAQALEQQQRQQATATPRAPVQLPQGSPEAQYEFAYALLLQAQRGQADFAPAEEGMRAFITANPSHRLAGNAQYWVGETHYVRKDWASAALAFGDGLKKYPNAEKGPDNMLKLGMSLAQLNKKQDACGAFAEVDRRYPSAAQAVKQTAARERQRNGC